MKRIVIGVTLLMITLGISMAQQAVIADELSQAQGFYLNRTQDLSKLPKMERDIIILQNVLNDLISSDNNGVRNVAYSSRAAKGMYIPGRGVIFNVKYRTPYSNVLFADYVAVAEGKETTEQTADEQNGEIESRIESLSKEFLVNYGSILSELKSGEKVMLNVEYAKLKPAKKADSGNKTTSAVKSIESAYARTVGFAYSRNSSSQRMVSSIGANDIESYLNGKLSLEQAFDKVVTTKNENEENSNVDARIMAGILDDLFRSNLDGKFRRSRKTSWTYFNGFGLMFDLNLNPSRNESLIIVDGEILDSSKEKASDEDKKNAEREMSDNLDELIEMAKESLVTYGRTLRSVKQEEVVILNLNLGNVWSRSGLPKSVRLQVSKSQIEAYARGQKSLDQLKKEIDIKKLSTSNTNGPFVTGYVSQEQALFPATIRGRTVGIGRKAKSQQ